MEYYRCARCLKVKSQLDMHTTKRQRSEGLLGAGYLCKVCARAVHSINSNNYRIENKERVAEHIRKIRAADTRKYKAQNMVGNAVRDGKLKRLPCVICGTPDTVGHHPDYNFPLEVVWYCQLHHKEEHKRLRKEKEHETNC